MIPSRTARLAAVMLSATALVACSGSSGTAAPSTAATTDPDCVPGDLADSEFGGHLRTNRIPTSTSEYLHFTVQENAYDSCRDLSWVLLDGSIGDINGDYSRPAGTMVLFTGDRVVGDYRPPLYAGVEKARRLEENAVLVTWNHNTAPGTSEESYSLENDHLDLIGTSVPDELRGRVPVIDVRNPPLDSQAGLPPAGNALGSPYAAELPTGRYLVPLNNDQSLHCELGRDDGRIADCFADFPASWDEAGSNHVRYTISPAEITLDNAPAPDARGLGNLARDSMYRVGTAVVDLRERDVAKIGLEPGQGVHISPGFVGPIND